MIDSGVSTLFINKRFVKEHNVTTQKLKDSIPVYNIDGTPNQAGHITHVAVLGMRIGEHNEQAVFTVTDIGPEDVIIGIDWLRKHNPSIDWYEGLVVMDGCPDECHIKPVREKSNTKNERLASSMKRTKPKQTTQRPSDSLVDILDEHESPDEPEYGPTQFDPERLARSQARSVCTQIGGKGTPRRTIKSQPEPLLAKGDRLFVMASYSTELALAENMSKPTKTFEEMVPVQYRDFAKVFSEEESHRLPEHKPWDHTIKLIPEAKEWCAKVYPLGKNEQEELDKFLDENLKKCYIRPSKSPMASPFFFVKKKNGGLRPVQDYRRLNDITVKNSYLIPPISDLMDRLKGSRYYTKLDVRWGYNNVRIKDGDEYKAAFVTNRGLYKPTVMFFGLCNSPTTFQNVMNDIFSDLVAEGKVTVYMDDILIFSADLEEHRQVVREVLKRLEANDMYLKPSKCMFEQSEVEYLGVI